MRWWLLALVLLLAPSMAAADDVPDPPSERGWTASDPWDGPESDFDRGYRTGQAMAPLCCLCFFLGGTLTVGGVAFFVFGRKKNG